MLPFVFFYNDSFDLNSRLSRLEVDTICLPFPQLVDHPLDPGNPILSPSSIEINYEDSRRWTHYEIPITIDDI